MKSALNECIDCKAFGALILDYEWEEDKKYNFPAYVSCRVLIEDLYKATIHAASREEAITIFRTGKWKEAIT